ncbi:homoserine kinase [Flavimobilis marinus]|uniref:Homoserine kinase n=1 Tax=Flavimobilis marinus TaxID=285351 RepID=A0A1I2HK84_9MICO|nr:homoserine kinase [Flavimobilis marinus]GHG57145.1 homoserine kinase [Flavimobilis marinus]SFF30092.1 homoserine kinase [Flavimobilis marinus]
MRLGTDHVRVAVPATSANLGPGFDALGLALGRYDTIEVRALGSPGARVEVEGEGAGEVPDGEEHLVVRALRAAIDVVGAPQTGLHLLCDNRIPHGRGLGSSAGAVVAGIAAARALIADPEALDDDLVLALATEFEGHPDNAAPAVLGGATVSWLTPDGVRARRFAVHDDVEPWVLVPHERLATSRARGVLPSQVPHADAAFNAGRAALLVEALSRAPELLFDATDDRLHQGYRSGVMAATAELVGELRGAGLPAVVSGAGPTVLVLARASDGDASRVALDDALRSRGDAWRLWRPGIDTSGVRTERLGVRW